MKNTASETVPFWLDPKKRAIFFQLITLCMVGLLAYYLISNTIHNLKRQNIATGLGFLHKESSFEIGESLISYSAASSYGRALIVGPGSTAPSDASSHGRQRDGTDSASATLLIRPSWWRTRNIRWSIVSSAVICCAVSHSWREIARICVARGVIVAP